MANLKEVRSRIQSVLSTQQITKAMKMVAAAKLRKAQDAITQMRPYSNKLTSLLQNLSSAAGTDFESPFMTTREANKILLVCVTSDRGLCGAFNSNIIKLVSNLYHQDFAGKEVTILCIGKKGYDFFSKRMPRVNGDFHLLFSKLSYSNVQAAANWIMDEFAAQNFDKVLVCYNEFKNVATQIIQQEQWLPFQAPQNAPSGGSKADYIYEPDQASILMELIPKSLSMQLYKAILDSNASEQGARMTAMDKATENAGELIKELKLMYNRTRQASITTEILEIVGGAEALVSG
jgi:F-type H+-transporting ATPase subunit gamma